MIKGSRDSLGTRTLGGRGNNEKCFQNNFGPSSLHGHARFSNPKTRLPVTLSDVSFFGDSDAETDAGRKFQRTLAIIKPEAAHLMYKIECFMAQNGFIVIKVLRDNNIRIGKVRVITRAREIRPFSRG